MIDLCKWENFVHWHVGKNLITNFKQRFSDGFFKKRFKFVEEQQAVISEEFVCYGTYKKK